MNSFFTDNEIRFNTISALTQTQLNSLYILVKQCDNYEPFYSCEKCSSIIMFTAEHKGNIIAFLSLLINNEDSSAEITALVAPAYRMHGIFSRLFSMAKNFIANSQSFSRFLLTGAVSDVLIASHFPFAKELIFTEYMMKLTKEQYHNQTGGPETITHNACTETISVLVSSASHCIDFSLCEFCFSDDNTAYLMYENEYADEPCALLNISTETTFSNIYGVWVDENIRGIGVGTILMQAFLEDYFDGNFLPASGLYDNPTAPKHILPLILNVRSTNTAACRLYKKCGFTEASHISYYLFS